MKTFELFEEEDTWPEGTVVRVTDGTFTASRTMSPQEHMRRMQSGQHGMPIATFKRGDLLQITGYSDSTHGYWDVLFDYFDEKKRGRDDFVCPEPHLRRHVEKDDRAWINSLKESARTFDLMQAVEDIHAAFWPRGGEYNILKGDQFYFLKKLPDGRLLLQIPHGAGKDHNLNLTAPADALSKTRNLKRERDKNFFKGLKESEEYNLHYEDQECWVIAPFKAAYADHGSLSIPFYNHEMLQWQRESASRVWFKWEDRFFKVDKDVFYSAVTFDKKKADTNWMNSLKEEVEDLPTWEEFNKACELAVAEYQQECNIHWRENTPPEAKNDKGPMAYKGPDAQLDDSDEHPVYWNPATKDFIIPVIDGARGSMDYGVYAHVHASGVVEFTDGPPKEDALEKMTDDPKILAKIKARKEANRNRFIKIDDPDNLP